MRARKAGSGQPPKAIQRLLQSRASDQRASTNEQVEQAGHAGFEEGLDALAFGEDPFVVEAWGAARRGRAERGRKRSSGEEGLDGRAFEGEDVQGVLSERVESDGEVVDEEEGRVVGVEGFAQAPELVTEVGTGVFFGGIGPEHAGESSRRWGLPGLRMRKAKRDWALRVGMEMRSPSRKTSNCPSKLHFQHACT